MECGDVVDVEPYKVAACSCGWTVAQGDADGSAASHWETALSAFDIWNDTDDLVVVGWRAVDVAIRRATVKQHPISAVLAVWQNRDRNGYAPRYGGLAPTIIACADVEQETCPNASTFQHIERILTFGRKYHGSRILVHCSQGMGRAPASALAIVADRLGPGREEEALEAVLKLRPCAMFNQHIVALADMTLDRRGTLAKAVKWHPLLRARRWARRSDTGWQGPPGLLMPYGGGEDLSEWEQQSADEKRPAKQ